MTEADALERQMLELINAERAKVGAGALQLELTLNQAAEDHTLWMIATDTFSHTGVGGSSAGQRMEDAGFEFAGSWSWGENLAGRTIRGPEGFSDEVEGLHTQLMNSSGHRANLLNDNFDYVGIGIEIGEYNGSTWAFVTQKFARTSGNVDLDPASGGAPASAAAPAFAPAQASPVTLGAQNSISTTLEGLEYIASYGDLMAAFGANASAGIAHFNPIGVNEGRSITFDALEYIASYDDLIFAFDTNAEAGASHYIVSGAAEGRQTSFDALEYIASHADLIAAFGANEDAGSLHYISAGRNEGRTADAFDAGDYLAKYADLRAAFGSDAEAAVVHFITQGYAEGRTDDLFG